MDRFLILGAYGFLGFEISCAALERGYIVYHLDRSDSKNDAVFEEKQLLIGRNSNFQVVDEQLLTQLEEEIQIVIPIYDWAGYREEQKVEMQQQMSSLFHLLDHKNISFLLPIQEKANFLDWLEEVDFSGRSWRIFFYPQLYGKWLPPSSILYQLFKENSEENVLEGQRTDAFEIIDVQKASEKTMNVLETKDEGFFLLTTQDDDKVGETIRTIQENFVSKVSEERKEIILLYVEEKKLDLMEWNELKEFIHSTSKD
ncbi:hypothetical protein OEV98_02570 [Caldibacillus lycopersici]|uniref:NAD(P)-dependent oxidoreductase n=1 Tax=Perspicuibacillus lycopersici TaxID=1325689 RepID=A0AAE3LM06_9BACI|nr:hypothetical protein [Perspicuibacillus lycopersici]MCU9612446.1 hypothetical protein [Perspicuibacillus lycopersici]